MKNYNDLKSYIQGEWGNQIFAISTSFIKENLPDAAIVTDRVPVIIARWLEETIVTSVYTETEDKDKVKIHARVRALLAFKGFGYGSRHNDVEDDQKYIYLHIVLSAIFIEAFSSRILLSVGFEDEKDPFILKNSATKAFIPYMSEGDLDEHAERFLEKFCPEALEKPMPLPVSEVLKKLEVKALKRNLPEGIFGKTYFIDNPADNATKNTIVFDPEQGFIRGIGSINNTIIHECVHWYFHRRFFYLMHLLDPSLSAISCATVEADIKQPKIHTDEFKWMEWQANALTPRILMPSKTTLQVFNERLASAQKDYKDNESRAYEEAIKETAEFFHVSKASAKIRLIQLGIKKASGIDTYVDGKKAPTFFSASPSIQSDQTFAVDFPDAVFFNLTNPTLRESLKKGEIVYANGFLVINNPKYVEKPERGPVTLTNYALSHMDECCLVFDVEHSISRSFDSKYYSMCFLCKIDGLAYAQKTFNPQNKHNTEILDKAPSLAEVIDDQKEIDEFLYLHGKDDFMHFFEALIVRVEYVNNSEISRATHLDDKTIANYRSGKTRPGDLKTVLALCAGFYLEPRISYYLIGLCGQSIGKSNNDIEHAYKYLIDNCFTSGIDVWNDKLLAIGKMGITIP